MAKALRSGIRLVESFLTGLSCSQQKALILVTTLGGPTMFACIGVMRALNRHIERVFDSSRKTSIGDGES